MPTPHWLTRDADIHVTTLVSYRFRKETLTLSTGDMLIQEATVRSSVQR